MRRTRIKSRPVHSIRPSQSANKDNAVARASQCKNQKTSGDMSIGKQTGTADLPPDFTVKRKSNRAEMKS